MNDDQTIDHAPQAAPRRPAPTTTALAPRRPATDDAAPPAPDGPHDLVADPTRMTGIGSVRFTAKQAALLLAPARDEEIDVLPTGEIYGAQVHVRRRLNAAFGPGGWGLRPLGEARVMGNTLTQQWGLVVGRRWVSLAWGEADYHASNSRMSWSTTTESLKSNALTRCCKDIGVLSECWDKRFADAWRERCCVKVYRTNTPKDAAREGERWQWRRKDAPAFWDEKPGTRRVADHDDHTAGQDRPRATHATPPTAQGMVARTITEEQRTRLFDLCRTHGVSNGAMRAHLVALGVQPKAGADAPTTRELPARQYDAVVAWAMRGGK
jgi:hypothetical protein